jgi:O-antigen/teichoic acid export membrane protein
MFLKNKIFKNFSALTTVNFISLLFPIVAIPYLIKTLGVISYGQLAYHQYIGQFILIILDLGLPLYAVGEVARRAKDRHALGSFILGAYIIKISALLLVIIGVSVIVGIAKMFNWAGVSAWFLVAFVGVAVFNSFAPTWLYQGLETLHQTIWPTLFSRSITLVSTFALIRSPEDLAWAPVPYLIGAASLFGLLSWRAVQNLHFELNVCRESIRKIFFESLQVFWSRLTIMSYVTISPILVNLAAGSEGVAIYNVCEKVISVARMPFDMLSAASYAHFSCDYQPKTVRRFLGPLGLGGVISALILALVAPAITLLFANPDLKSLPNYLAIYGLALAPISMHGFLGTCVLLANGRRFELTKSILVGLSVYGLCMLVMWPRISDKIGLAISTMVLVEFGILFTRLFFSIKYRLI